MDHLGNISDLKTFLGSFWNGCGLPGADEWNLEGTHFNTCVNGKKFLHHLDCHLKFNNFFSKAEEKLKVNPLRSFFFQELHKHNLQIKSVLELKKEEKKIVFCDILRFAFELMNYNNVL